MGGLLGLILAMAIHNLFLFFSIRDRIFLYYSLHTIAACYLILKSYGLHHEFFLPNSPILNTDGNTTNFITITLAVRFVSKFLNTRALVPTIHKWLVGVCVW